MATKKPRKKRAFKKLPPVKGSVACATCGCGARTDLNMQREITVGFGGAGYSRDGRTLWQDDGSGKKCPTVGRVEKLASEDPDHDWRIFFNAPLYDAEYQRQGDGVWVLVSKGWGFYTTLPHLVKES